MDLQQLAKDPDSGRVGCPSVHLDRDSGALLVQGDGMAEGVVRIKASIVLEALAEPVRSAVVTVDDQGPVALGPLVPGTVWLVVTGDEFDVSLLPSPLPGERAVWSDVDTLVDKLRAAATAMAEQP